MMMIILTGFANQDQMLWGLFQSYRFRLQHRELVFWGALMYKENKKKSIKIN